MKVKKNSKLRNKKTITKKKKNSVSYKKHQSKSPENKIRRTKGTSINANSALSENKTGLLSKKFLERRKHVEDELIESQKILNTIFESAADGILIADLETKKFVNCNPMICKMLGYTQEELLSLSVTDIHPGKDLSYVLDQFTRQSKKEFSLAKNIPVRRKDGSVFYTDVNSTPILFNGRKSLAGFFRDIDERKQIEEELRESEERFRTLADTTATAIFVYQEDKFVYSNKAAQKISGYTEEEFLSKNFWDFVHPDFRDLIKERGLARLRGEKVVNNYEFKIICKDGSEKWIDFTAGSINWKGKKSAIGTAFDITFRKQAEEALRQSEEKYRNNFNNAPVGIYQSSLSGRFLSVNNRLVQILGYDYKEELLQKLIDTDIYFDKEEREKLITEYERSGSVADLEVKWKKKDGTPIWIQLTTSAVKDKTGKTILFDGFVRDISDHKKAEIEIRKLYEAVAQSPASIIITDLDGNIDYVNKTFEVNTGYTFAEVYKKNPRILKSGHTSKDEYKLLWDTILSGKTWRGEFLNKKKNGELYWEDVLISPVKDKDGNTINYLAVKQDITEKKKMIQDLIEAKEVAEKANKLKSEFLSQMSHEIRSPLNVVLNMSNLIKEEFNGGLTQDQLRFFNGIELAGKRIIRTVSLILNLSELQVGTYRPVFKDVNLLTDVFDKIREEYSQKAKEKGLGFNIYCDMPATRVFGDLHSINQIFVNLVDNAIKYTNHGEINLFINRDQEGNLYVSIEDTGIGISYEYMNMIFEPFTQEERGYSRRFEGSGLGLALVKKYCELNNAKITVESRKGKGSKFTVSFH